MGIRPASSAEKIIEKFWKRIDRPVGEDACWQWTGRASTTGYGVIKIGGRTAPVVLAHRFSFQQTYGPIPKDLCVLHRCDNRLCARPDHLFLGTRTDNMIDKTKKGRQSFTPKAKGELAARAKFTNEQAKQIRQLYQRQVVTAPMLAVSFGVNVDTIRRILQNKTYVIAPDGSFLSR